MSQNETVLNFLKQPNASLTCKQASRNLDIDRLSARIGDRRDAGHNINTQMVNPPSGKPNARYTILPKTT